MHSPTVRRILTLAALALPLGACAGLTPQAPSTTPASAAPSAALRAPELGRYLETLAGMAPGDPARQQATLDGALAATSSDPSPANRLSYALALGSAGHAGSDPIEARQLITELLAGNHDLQSQEVELASAFLREFDARVALYAELARQRDESERELSSVVATAQQRADASAAENAKLRRALAAAERKLEAVAEMERSLLDQAADPTDEAPSPPQP